MKTRPALSVSRCIALVLAGLALATPGAAQDSFGGTPPQQRQQQQPQQQPQPAPYAPPVAPAGTAPGTSFAPAAPANDALARQAQAERQDMGVAATTSLKSGGLHGPTPNQLPGGRLVTTA